MGGNQERGVSGAVHMGDRAATRFSCPNHLPPGRGVSGCAHGG